MREFAVNFTQAIVVALLLSPLAAQAGNYQQEIEYLLLEIEKSSCTFHRNGSEHNSVEAADHLRMKYGRVRSRIDSSEKFIDLLATKSSWTGNNYQLECEQGRLQPSGGWLHEMLEARRLTEGLIHAL